jgi:hypothetical protein
MSRWKCSFYSYLKIVRLDMGPEEVFYFKCMYLGSYNMVSHVIHTLYQLCHVCWCILCIQLSVQVELLWAYVHTVECDGKTEQIDSIGNDSGLHSESTRFEPSARRQLSWLREFMVYFPVLLGIFGDSTLNYTTITSFLIPCNSLFTAVQWFDAIYYQLLTAFKIK